MDAALRRVLVEGATRMGVDLDADALNRFGTLLSLLQLWGGKINLTARSEGREVVIHHFLDSLAGARFLADDPGARLVDIGAGAGFPSFPLKFALPGLRVAMVESVRKKVSFCQEVIRATGCAGIEATCARAEDLARREGWRGTCDWAVSRALAASADVVRLAVPLLRPGGRILLYKGAPDRKELDDLTEACERIGAAWDLHRVEVPHLDARRSLIVVALAGP